MAKDVVCGMEVKESEARKEDLVRQVDNVEYFFCSQECTDEFDKNPERFVQTSIGKKSETRKGMAKQSKPSKANTPMASTKSEPQKKQKK